MCASSRQQIAAIGAFVFLCSASAADSKPNSGTAAENKSAAALPAVDSATSGAVAKVANGIDVTHPYGYYLGPILEKIKATDDQRQKIVAVVQSYKSRIQPLRDEYKQRRQEFINSMTSGGAAESIMTKQVELSHLLSEISSKYTLMRLEIRRVLTPQQILLLEDYARQHGWNH